MDISFKTNFTEMNNLGGVDIQQFVHLSPTNRLGD
jgi:hypothetical protein